MSGKNHAWYNVEIFTVAMSGKNHAWYMLEIFALAMSGKNKFLPWPCLVKIMHGTY